MNESRKYEELDKSVSRQIMKEFEGKAIDHVCDECGGKGEYRTRETCQNCDGTGTVTIQY